MKCYESSDGNGVRGEEFTRDGRLANVGADDNLSGALVCALVYSRLILQ